MDKTRALLAQAKDLCRTNQELREDIGKVRDLLALTIRKSQELRDQRTEGRLPLEVVHPPSSGTGQP